jgi:hemerythrin-like metal-binding protein
MDMASSKQLSVGNRMIDSMHKELFHKINVIVHLIWAKDMAALSEAFVMLEHYLSNYFAVEEKVAQAIGFDFGQHRQAHQYLLKELKHQNDALMAKDELWTKLDEKKYIDFLRNCFILHIKEDSNPLKILLETHFYDFKPDGQ